MIKILFICLTGMLKNSEKACKINDFIARKGGGYYITITPFEEEL